jgi:hypothetical protein
LSDATKSPAAAVVNTVYDMFVWVDRSTPTAPVVRCTRGPAWTSSLARSLTLQRLNGIWTNASAITNGPAINLGTYVGSILTDAGAAAVSMKFGTTAALGGQAYIGIWNTFNRIEIGGMVSDSTASWTYASTAYRSANGSVTNSVVFVRGLAEDRVEAIYSFEVSTATGNASLLYAGIGLDSTTGTAAKSIRTGAGFQGTTAGPYGPSVAFYNENTAIGAHYLYALEGNPLSIAVTINGNPTQGLQYSLSG